MRERRGNLLPPMFRPSAFRGSIVALQKEPRPRLPEKPSPIAPLPAP